MRDEQITPRSIDREAFGLDKGADDEWASLGGIECTDGDVFYTVADFHDHIHLVHVGVRDWADARWGGPNCGINGCAREVDHIGDHRGDPERVHIPTPDELNDLMADISACGYASEAVQVVEDWTRKWWGVESGDTTRWSK